MNNYGIKISHQPGFYQSGIQLSISAEDKYGVKIFFTKNGDIPDLSSNQVKNFIKIDSTTALTLAVSRGNKLIDTFFCGTYFIDFKSALPVTTIIIPSSSLFNPISGIYLGGLNADNTTYGNCWKDIEKPAFFEYFSENRDQIISQYCGLKIFGGMTRQNKEKSLRVIARKKYGKGKFKGDIFKTKKIQSFNSLVLRISGNDFLGTRFLDMMCSSLAKDMDIDYMAYQPSVLFVNGKYWGIHNVREKIGDDYLSTNHGADISKTDLLIGNASPKTGNSSSYNSLINFLNTQDPNSNYFIDSVSSKMDIDNYFKFVILQIHIVNVDSRGNIKFWRSSNLDGKFRWIFYDSDLSFSSPNLNFLEKRVSPVQTDWYNPVWTTVILRKLIQNEELKNRFINQYCYLLSTVLSNDTIQSRISYFRNWILPEIDRHLKRKDFNQSRNSWEDKIGRLRNFSETRKQVSIDNLKSVLHLKNTYELNIGSNVPYNYFTVDLSGNKNRNSPFKGNFFNGIPLPLFVSYVHPLYQFIKWSDGDTSRYKRCLVDNQKNVKLDLVFSKSEKSNDFQSWKIAAIKTAEHKNNPWIFIQSNGSDKKNFLGYINLPILETEYKINAVSAENNIIITADSALWKKEHPTFFGTIVEIANFELTSDHIEYYLLDCNHKIIDSISNFPSTSNSNQNHFFIIRNGDKLEYSVIEPQFSKKTKAYSSSKISFYTIILLLLIGLIFFINKKYKQNKKTAK